MAVFKGRVLWAVLCAAAVFTGKAIGQNIAQSTNQISQSTSINADNNVNYNAIQQGINIGRPTANFIPSLPQAAQSISSAQQVNLQQANLQQANLQQANLQQASNNYNPYTGSLTSSTTTVTESSSSLLPGISSQAPLSNAQAANIPGLSGQQQYKILNQNPALSLAQPVQNVQSLSTISNQVAIPNNQKVLPSYQTLPANRYPFGGNFEIPFNLEVSLPPVSIAVADQLGPVSTLPSSPPAQLPYNPYTYTSLPFFPIPYSTVGGCRSGIRDLLPIFLVALCNNNCGRCGGSQCGHGCSNYIPVPVPIPIPFNPVIVKCGAEDEADDAEDTESKSTVQGSPS